MRILNTVRLEITRNLFDPETEPVINLVDMKKIELSTNIKMVQHQ